MVICCISWAVILLYPQSKYNFKTRCVAFLTSIIFYVGTYLSFLISWTKVGVLNAIAGVQTRYFIPLILLLPFILGFNRQVTDKKEIDFYVITIAMGFLAMQVIWYACKVY